MVEQPRPEFDVDAVGGVGEQVGAQGSEHHFEHRNRDHPHDQHVEGAETAMHQHLVDHHLEEQRRHQRENLQEEGGQQHLAQKGAIFVDRPHEPGDVEAACEIAEPGALAHQDQLAVPRRLELGLGHHDRPGCTGRLHDGLAVAGLAEDQEAAGAQRDDGRERRLVQPLPGRRHETRLDSELFCTAQHLTGADHVAKLVTDLLRVGRNAQESQQHDQRRETGIGGRAGCRG